MTEPIKFRSEAEARAWDGYAATLAAALVLDCGVISPGDDEATGAAAGADALLAERRKREGPTEGEIEKAHDLAVGAEMREGIAIDALKEIAGMGCNRDGKGPRTCRDYDSPRDEFCESCVAAEALVAAARGTK